MHGSFLVYADIVTHSRGNTYSIVGVALSRIYAWRVMKNIRVKRTPSNNSGGRNLFELSFRATTFDKEEVKKKREEEKEIGSRGKIEEKGSEKKRRKRGKEGKG